MLLQWSSVEFLTEEDALKFFNDNEMEIMGIYAQYASMYPDLEEEECSMLTIMYLLFGQNSETPDLRIEIPEEAEDLISNNEFLLWLYNYIVVADVLYQLTKKDILTLSQNCKGEKAYKLSKKYIDYKQQKQKNL